MNINEINRIGWDKAAAGRENQWCEPVDADTIARARAGDWSLILTPTIPVPTDWFGDVRGKRVLCLASGGGQQAPVLAAAGARVTSFDQSAEQLALDTLVAERDGLAIATVQGDMADLSVFADASFDLIFNPVSNVFAADIVPVWRECRRVLVAGGRLLSSCMNPDYFLFDHEDIEEGGPMRIRYSLPFADITSLPVDRLEKKIADRDVLEFSHGFEAQLGEQMRAGFAMHDFYEDFWTPDMVPVGAHMAICFAMLSIAR